MARGLWLPRITCTHLFSFFFPILLICGSGTLMAQTVLTTTLPLLWWPDQVVINPAMDRVYVWGYDPDSDTGGVTVIDGSSNTTTVFREDGAYTMAVNPTTDKIYITESSRVRIFDGTTHAEVGSVIVGALPLAIAVNPVTNKIYVANTTDNTVTVIDGATLTSTTLRGIDFPTALAVNPATNKIYVAGCEPCGTGFGQVTVIDGATNTTKTLKIEGPRNFSINPVTNKIYVAANTLVVIDGATNTTTSIPIAAPRITATNSVTNKIYAAHQSASLVTVIDGATNATSTVNTDGVPTALAINSLTNTIYVRNGSNGKITIIHGADNSTASVSVGERGREITVNPVTNKIYASATVSNNKVTLAVIDGSTNSLQGTVTTSGRITAMDANPATDSMFSLSDVDSSTSAPESSSFTIIDGATGASVIVPGAVSNVKDMRVNPVTNKAYSYSALCCGVWVVDASTKTAENIDFAEQVRGIAVNPVTNKIFAVSEGDLSRGLHDALNIVDGATKKVSQILLPASPNAVAVNPTTNNIYVSLPASSTVLVVNGATKAQTAIAVGTDPIAVAVDSKSNKAYVLNSGSEDVTVIDDTTYAATTVPVGRGPVSLAVNPQTGQTYVANSGSNSVTVIDGWRLATRTITTGTSPSFLAIDVRLNKVYVACTDGITVIDGIFEATSTIAVSDTSRLAVSPVTGKIYAAQGGTVNMIAPDLVANVPLSTAVKGVMDTLTVTGLSIFGTLNDQPSFAASVTSTFSPIAPKPRALYYQLDDAQGRWNVANPGSASGATSAYTFSLADVGPGVHVLYSFATYGDEANISLNGYYTMSSAPLTSNLNAYTFVVFPSAASITNPASGSKLTGSSATFIWSGAPTGATFTLLVGKTAGASDIANINAGTATSATITGIPTDGVHFYVKLITSFSGKTFSNFYSFIEAGTPVKAAILTPAPNSTLGKHITFTWNTGKGVTNYKLDLGSIIGDHDLGSVTTTSLSALFSYLPMTGETVYARLSSLIDGAWQYNDYTYTAISAATLTSPTPGTTITGTSMTFTWTSPTGATGYRIGVGTGPLGFDLADIHTGLTTATVNNLPTDGRMLYVTLVTDIANNSYRNMYTFTASGTAVKGEITSPAPGGKLPDSTVTFQWTGSGVTFYSLYIGSKKGSGDLATIMVGRPTSYTVNNLPTDSRTLYVTLLSLIHGVTQYSYYTYTAADPPQAAMISPTQGTKFDSTSATFTWTPGRNVLGVWLYVGTRHGDSDIARLLASKKTSLTVDNLPSDGRLLYVTLISWVNGVPLYNHYTYIAKGTPAKAEMTSPAPNSTLPGSTATFQWTTGTGVTSYTLLLGTTPARAELTRQVLGTATSYTATGLPTDGSTIYATLVSYIDGVGQYTVYTYTAASSATASTASPAIATQTQ